MSETVPVGVALRQSFHFIRAIHKDCLILLGALDQMMAARRWYPIYRNKIANELSNSLDAEAWLISSIFRLYTRDRDRKADDQLAAVEIAFNPPDTYEEPVCLCLAATFPQKTSTEEMWNLWEADASNRVLTDLRGATTPQALDSGARDRIQPRASWANAFAVNLCTLSDESAVQRVIVDPLLNTLQQGRSI